MAASISKTSARMFSDRGTPQGGTRLCLPRRSAWNRDHHRGGLHQCSPPDRPGHHRYAYRGKRRGRLGHRLCRPDQEDVCPTRTLPFGQPRGCYRGRGDGMNQWKSAHAVERTRATSNRHQGRRRFCRAVDERRLPGHGEIDGRNPIIFAMANPDPEITPEDVKAVRDDAIIATGRSDYPNQVNNVLGPYLRARSTCTHRDQ